MSAYWNAPDCSCRNISSATCTSDRTEDLSSRIVLFAHILRRRQDDLRHTPSTLHVRCLRQNDLLPLPKQPTSQLCATMGSASQTYCSSSAAPSGLAMEPSASAASWRTIACSPLSCSNLLCRTRQGFSVTNEQAKADVGGADRRATDQTHCQSSAWKGFSEFLTVKISSDGIEKEKLSSRHT